MVDSAQGPGGSQGPKYNPQYKVSPQFKKFWETLFKQQPLTDDEVSKMTDQFVRQVWNSMNQVLKHALQAMKDLEAKRKEDEGS